MDQGYEFEYVGERYFEGKDHVLIDQEQYADSKLKEVTLAKNRYKQRDSDCTAAELHAYRSVQGSLAWLTGRTRPELQYESSVAATRFNCLKVKDVNRLNKAVRVAKDPRWRYKLRIPKLKKENGFRVVIVPDAGEGELAQSDWSKAQGGRIVGIMSEGSVGDTGELAICDIRSTKLKRVTHSSFDAECVNTIEAADVALGVVELIHEYQHGIRPSRVDSVRGWLQSQQWPDLGPDDCVKMEIHTDCQDVADNVETLGLKDMSKRRRVDIADLKELRTFGQLRRMLHVSGSHIHADPLTKQKTTTKATSQRLVQLLANSWYEPVLK